MLIVVVDEVVFDVVGEMMIDVVDEMVVDVGGDWQRWWN